MDPMTIMGWIVTAVQYAPTLANAINEANSNHDLTTKAKNILGPLSPVFEKLGSMWFPDLAKEFHLAAAVMSVADPSVTKSIQGALNVLVSPPLTPQLVVDGVNGPLTKAAVKLFQTQMGLDVDGWAGNVTRLALDTAMAKLG